MWLSHRRHGPPSRGRLPFLPLALLYGLSLLLAMRPVLAISQPSTTPSPLSSNSRISSSIPLSMTLDQALDRSISMQLRQQQALVQLRAQLDSSQAQIDSLRLQLSRSKADSQAASIGSAQLRQQLMRVEQDRQSYTSMAQSQIRAYIQQRDRAQKAAHEWQDIAIGAAAGALAGVSATSATGSLRWGALGAAVPLLVGIVKAMLER